MSYKTYTCPVARSCGGCEWLAVPYPIQLKRKREALQQQFADFDVPVGEVLGMEEPVGYRAKIASPFVKGAAAATRPRTPSCAGTPCGSPRA